MIASRKGLPKNFKRFSLAILHEIRETNRIPIALQPFEVEVSVN